ncbi:MAG: hypothetical protein R3B96_12760 [Pirellulaceae bacterium]
MDERKATRAHAFFVAVDPRLPKRWARKPGKPKETRSVSEGFFDFSIKPSTRHAIDTSV